MPDRQLFHIETEGNWVKSGGESPLPLGEAVGGNEGTLKVFAASGGGRGGGNDDSPADGFGDSGRDDTDDSGIFGNEVALAAADIMDGASDSFGARGDSGNPSVRLTPEDCKSLPTLSTGTNILPQLGQAITRPLASALVRYRFLHRAQQKCITRSRVRNLFQINLVLL